MRKLIPITISLLLLLGTATLAASRRQHVLTEFQLSPDMASLINRRATDSPLRLQVLVLDLKHFEVYFHDDQVVRLRDKSEPNPVYRKLLLLEKGHYLLEYTFYDTRDKRFELLACSVRVDKSRPQDPVVVPLRLTSLSHDNLDKVRRTVLYNPGRPETAFNDQMIWERVEEYSLRNPEQWPSLYAKLKIASHDIQASAYSLVRLQARYNYSYPPLMYPDYIPEVFISRNLYLQNARRLPWVVTDRLFKMAVHVDNITLLTKKWDTDALSPKAQKDLLKRVDKEARDIRRIGQFLYLKEIFDTPFDKDIYMTNLGDLQLNQLQERLISLGENLQSVVMSSFFSASSSANQAIRLGSLNPDEVAEQIRIIIRMARKKL